MEPKECPECHCNLVLEDIYEYYIKKGWDAEVALKHAKMFGWTNKKPTNFNRVIAIYDVRKDRTTHWLCPDCSHTWKRESSDGSMHRMLCAHRRLLPPGTHEKINEED